MFVIVRKAGMYRKKYIIKYRKDPLIESNLMFVDFRKTRGPGHSYLEAAQKAREERRKLKEQRLRKKMRKAKKKVRMTYCI